MGRWLKGVLLLLLLVVAPFSLVDVLSPLLPILLDFACCSLFMWLYDWWRREP